MAVLMKRSTKIALVSLSTSYLTGSAFIGISMITLKDSGTFLPGVTLSRDMVRFSKIELHQENISINPNFTYYPPAAPRKGNFHGKVRALANRLHQSSVD